MKSLKSRLKKQARAHNRKINGKSKFKFHVLDKDTGELIFEGDSLVGANLENGDLTNFNFMGEELHETPCHYANFKNADMRGAIMFNANFRSCNFDGADLRGVHIHKASFYGARVTGAILDEGVVLSTKPKGGFYND